MVSACSRPEPQPDYAPAGLVPGTPNILIVTLDTTRADHLGCYGYFRDTSPNLDRLAEESVLFERCIVPMATTLPTHTSLFTGTHPHEHGVLANLKRTTIYERDASLVSLAEYLSEIGYTTGAFVSAFPLRRKAGLATGFSVYSDVGKELRRASDTVSSAKTWLKEQADSPFFLWVHLFDPHGPFEPLPPFDEQFQDSDELQAWMTERELESEGGRLRGKPVYTVASINGYDGEIAFMDQQLGVLFQDLRTSGLWDDLVMVVMGDHGEGLNQHGLPGHGRVFDEQLHAPLLLRAPGLAPGRFEDPVSGVDVLPTLMHLLQLPDPETLLSQGSGINRFAGSQGPGSEWILSQSSPRQLAGGDIEYGLTGRRWKYLRGSDGSERLYDLGEDPHELVDAAPEQPEVLARLRELTNAKIAAQIQRKGGTQREATLTELEGLQGLGYGGGDEDESQ